MVRQIAHKTLHSMITTGARFTLLDVRDTPEYRAAHLPGVVHLLISDIRRKVLDRNVLVVTYS